MKKHYKLLLLLIVLCASVVSSWAQPTIFHATTSAQPGEAVSIQGAFSKNAQVFLVTSASAKARALPVLTQIAGQVTVQLPAALPMDFYQVWVQDNGSNSNRVPINQATGMHFDTPEVAPGGRMRVFGRNLKLDGYESQVRFVDQNGGGGGTATIQGNGSDAYTLVLQAPVTLQPGRIYDVFVSNGRSETQVPRTITGLSPGGADYFQLGVPWATKLSFYTNVYDVKNDVRLSQKAVGDGKANELAALQAAIDRASADGGGVVFLPQGIYHLSYTGFGLTMRNKVVLMGAGQDKTKIQVSGNASGQSWTFLWDNTVQGGLADLTYENVTSNGTPYGNMTGSGTEIFLQRCRFILNTSDWLWMANSKKIVVANSEFTQGVDSQPGYHGPLQMNGCVNFVIKNNTVTYAVDGLNLNDAHDGVFENNQVNRDGAARYPTSLVNHVLILNFAQNVAVLNNVFRVINGPAQNSNDGETIIAEGGGADQIDEEAGTVSGASTTSLTDNTKNWGKARLHPVVAIVYGPGTGQWRNIVSRSGNQLQLDRPWEVVPTSGNRYAIFNWGARNWLVQGNKLEGNRRGITLYHNATTDVAIVNNTLTNSGSIDITPKQIPNNGDHFAPVFDTQIIGNTVEDLDGSNGVFIGVHTVQHIQERTFGTSVIGLEVRRNTLTAHTPNVQAVVDDVFPEGYLNYLEFHWGGAYFVDEQIPAILGSIFQDNTAINCDNAIYLNSGSYNTVVCNTRLINSANLIKDTRIDRVNHAAVGTASCVIEPEASGYQPPVADPKVNAVIPRNAGVTSIEPLSGSAPVSDVVGFIISELPTDTQGTLFANGNTAKSGALIPKDQANLLSFQPESGYTGQASFTYKAVDDHGIASTEAPFTIPVSGPLSVELMNFTVKLKEHDALLSWTTASEKTNEYFAVERSKDAFIFSQIGKVQGFGTTNNATNYNFIDRDVVDALRGTLYYRLRQVDTDGTMTYGPTRTVVVTDQQPSYTVSVYPNPTTSELHILLPVPGGRFTVYSTTGARLLDAQTNTAEGKLNVKQLASGSYLLLIESNQGEQIKQYFVKH